jgi:hypothetical protein
MSDTRELKLKMTFDVDPSKGSAAMNALAVDAKKIETAADRAQKKIDSLGKQSLADRSLALDSGGFAAQADWQRRMNRDSGLLGVQERRTLLNNGGFANQAADDSRIKMANDRISREERRKLLENGQFARDAQHRAAMANQDRHLELTERKTELQARHGTVGGLASYYKERTVSAVKGGIGSVAGAVGVIGGVAGAFGGLTEAAARLHDPLTTTNQKFVEAARAIPLVGDALGSLVQSVLNAVERLRDWEGSLRYDRKLAAQPRELARLQLQAGAEDKSRGLQRSARDAGLEAKAIERYPSLGHQEQALGGAIGFGAFGVMAARDPRLQEAMDAEQMARRAASAADDLERHSHVDFAKQEQATNRAQKELDRQNQRVWETGRAAGVGDRPSPGGVGGVKKLFRDQEWNPLKRDFWIPPSLQDKKGPDGAPNQGLGKQTPYKEALLDQERALAAQLKEQQRLLEAAERLGQKALASEQKKYDLMKAGTAVMKVRADLLQEEYDRSRQGSREFGAMDSTDQRGFYNAYQRFKQGGRDSVTNEEFQMISSSGLTGKDVGERSEQSVKDNPILKELQRQLGIRDTGTIEKELVKLKAEISAKVQLDEVQFARIMKEQMEGLSGNLEGLIKRIVSVEIQQIENKMKQGKAGGG